MGRIVNLDGALVPPEQAVVSVFDRGFLYGDSVYEVVRTYGGAPFELDAHLARLGSNSPSGGDGYLQPAVKGVGVENLTVRNGGAGDRLHRCVFRNVGYLRDFALGEEQVSQCARLGRLF